MKDKIKPLVKLEIYNFSLTLKKFGFKKLPNENAYGEPQNCYAHDKNSWFADIIDFGNFAEVWMVGKGLKDGGGMPGGWNYGSIKEIEDTLNKALNK